ncbi:hypothetical protein DFA_00940 [Cavenderia fasciculata]|uniref:Peptidase M16 family protein n=1 Tax=Cavenderia fasciculata TaxID=261658 RepID=F4PUP8_CACFS|nr:uncharacterized protein DFA_00940 [Cavenderia fasciculata]EGG21067.1 hypothetical protein DFA_00940 [Cavenderia fasciculata]|eukprot:XP_004358917.1 hypothetical protein DFA_00940 [Cavenderia fasciculata]
MKAEYKLLESLTVSNLIDVEKYKSSSGLTIYLANSVNPFTNGYIFIPTEASSHDGCPHTLEHLIFLGSEDYPVKGFLDITSTKCFANGTNAWTDVDHTAYTLKTAGTEGFLTALPIFLDHVLYPTLTDQGFLTEVHHINGEGKNSGVVYSEMQEVETKKGNMLINEATKYIYTSDCGFKYETGGKLEDLRSLKSETVRQFHKTFYRPDNVAILIVGAVNSQDVFKSIEKMEAKILSRGTLPPAPRPFSVQPTLFSQDIVKTVNFPSEDETVGDCYLCFNGDINYDQHELIAAISVLNDYLTDGVTSPVGGEMVDIEEPYASDVVGYDQERHKIIHSIYFSNCSVDRMDQIKDKFLEIMKRLVEEKEFDIERMRSIIEQSKQKTLFSLEKSPENLISDNVAIDFVYSKGPTEFGNLLSFHFDLFLEKDEQYWLDIIDRIYLKSPSAFFMAKPSKEESVKILETEKKRLEKQIQDLGETKLKELGQQIQDAKTFNDTPIDDWSKYQIESPSPNSIRFHQLVTVCDDKPLVDDQDHKKLVDYITSDSSKTLPFQMQFSHFEKTLFIQILMFFNTRNLPNHIRPYLELFSQLFFLSPIKGETDEEEEIISHEEVEMLLLDHFIENDFKNGFSFCFEQYMSGKFILVKENYEDGIDLIGSIFKDIIFDESRIKVIVQQCLDEIPSERNDAPEVARKLHEHHNFDKESSNLVQQNFQKQFVLLTKILQDFENQDKEMIQKHIDALETIKQLLNDPANITIQVAGNIYSLDNPKKPWEIIFEKEEESTSAAAVRPEPFFQYEVRDLQAMTKAQADVLFIPGTGSSHFYRVVPLALDYSQVITKEYASLVVATNYFTQMEGPIWKLLRGSGYCYSPDLSVEVEEGFLIFKCHRSSDPNMAFKISKDIVSNALKNELDAQWVIGARSQTVYDQSSRFSTIFKTYQQSVLNTLRKWGPNGFHGILSLIPQVNEQDMKESMSKYLVDLFDDTKSYFSLVSSDISNIQAIVDNFNGENGKPTLNIVSAEDYFK